MNCDDKLKELAPVFLRNMHGNPFETCMAWGCECGDGWEKPVADMCKKLEELNEGGYGYLAVADQIKSKFAELSVYWHVENADTVPAGAEVTPDKWKEFHDNAAAVISRAEDECSRTCERCGAPATKVTSGWWMHVCDACFQKRKEEKDARSKAD